MITFTLEENFTSPWLFPDDASVQYNFFHDLMGAAKFRFLPHQIDGRPCFMVPSLHSHGILRESGESLGKQLRELSMSICFMNHRLSGEGRDHWSEVVHQMSKLSPQFENIQVTKSGLEPMLESIAASAPKSDRGISPILSLNSVLIWDSRENHDINKFTNLDFESGQFIARSVVDGCDGRKFHGCLIRATMSNVDETAEKMRALLS